MMRVSAVIIMPYKEQCKTEGVSTTRVKIIRAVLSGTTQDDASTYYRCSKNTVGAIMCAYRALPDEEQAQIRDGTSFTKETLESFTGLSHRSRAPHGNKRSLRTNEEHIVLSVHKEITIGPQRMFTHLRRQGKDMCIFTLAKLKGCYKRHMLTSKKIRTANKERRPLYDYTALAAFERLHMDTKHITDKHALPKEIYEQFKHTPELPIYQWTLQDAKTRMRFLAYSHELSSFYGQRFLLLVVLWLRAHGIHTHLHTLFDGGAEFCSASKRKLEEWQVFFAPYGVTVEQTEGNKTRQNLIERSHRSDDEEFYCPRGAHMKTRVDFLVEAEGWNFFWNNERAHAGIGGMTPTEKLSSLGYMNATAIGSFPTFILEDVHQELLALSSFMDAQPKRFEVGCPQGVSQNVLTHYP